MKEAQLIVSAAWVNLVEYDLESTVNAEAINNLDPTECTWIFLEFNLSYRNVIMKDFFWHIVQNENLS